MFRRSRKVELADGRVLFVQYHGERHGWGAEIPGVTNRAIAARSPAEAIAECLGYAPAWAEELSQGLVRELLGAPRYACDCCGFRTLLNPAYYEICDVCGWEDDRCDGGRRRGGPDALSGPNHISLTEARANFARSGAAKA